MTGKRGGKRRSLEKAGVVPLFLIVAFIAILLLVQEAGLQEQLDSYNAQISELDSQIKSEQARSEEIEEYGKYTQTDEYVEQVAREKLGLVKDDEIIFKSDDAQ